MRPPGPARRLQGSTEDVTSGPLWCMRAPRVGEPEANGAGQCSAGAVEHHRWLICLTMQSLAKSSSSTSPRLVRMRKQAGRTYNVPSIHAPHVQPYQDGLISNAGTSPKLTGLCTACSMHTCVTLWSGQECSGRRTSLGARKVAQRATHICQAAQARVGRAVPACTRTP
jgi:hypothetical protein